MHWLEKPGEAWGINGMTNAVRNELGRDASAIVVLPPPGTDGEESFIRTVAATHVEEVERANRLGRLGDLTGVMHLELHLRQFLEDHPNPD